MRYFCTLFDKNYLLNFFALNESLEKTLGEFKIYAFCMDDLSYSILKNNINHASIEPVSLEKLSLCFPELVEIKKSRSIVEFYFTCSPFICAYLLKQEPNASHVTYLDADLYFFSSPEIIFEEMGTSSVGVIDHKFYGWGKRYVKYGKFNVGWVTFKNNIEGLNCLKSWLADCTSWCFDFYDDVNKRFGDQKYLDKWVYEFEQVKVITNIGANVAPWNIGQYKVTKGKKDEIFINNTPMIFYHYASFKKISEGLYTTSISKYLASPNKVIKEDIYMFYINCLSKYKLLVENSTLDFEENFVKKNRLQVHKNDFSKKIQEFSTRARRCLFNDYIKL